MAAMHQQSRLVPQRYSISQLLQISRDGKKAFDLSKFTYDAARAGVVPPLGEIAMPFRRTSNQRIRAWSSESTEALSEVRAVSGNATSDITPIEPRRQPSNPPIDLKVEKDTGFARFLRKHSSPTHNRVTAGGRIVPMEKRGSPPKFELDGARISVDTDRRASKEGCPSCETGSCTPLDVQIDQEVNTETRSMMPPQHGDLLSNSTVHTPTARLETKDSDGHSVFPQYPVYNGTSLGPNTSEQIYGGQSLGQFHPAMGYHFVPQVPILMNAGLMSYGNPYPVPPHASSIDRDRFAGVEPTTQLLVTAQSCLAQAQAQYELLDRQLQAMDRHRAMSNHDPSLSAQRMAVVQQRADIKAMINRLAVQVEMLQMSKAPAPAEPLTSLMAAAQPFVPQTAANYTESPRRQSTSASVEVSAESDRGFPDKAVGSGRRKIIPIVRPTPPSPTMKHDIDNSASEPARGRGPGSWDIHDRHASNSILPHVPMPGDHLKFKPKGVSEAVAETAPVPLLEHPPITPEVIEWSGDRPGSLPSELEHMNELYFDALRLPKGVIAVFSLENGDSFEVCGADMQQPAVNIMSDKELVYWNKKPVFTENILKELKSKATIIGEVRSGADDGAGECASSTMQDAALLQNNVQKRQRSHVDVQSLLTEAAEVEARRKQSTLDKTRIVPGTTTHEADSTVSDELSNKGYISVSVQNVHAHVRLPPSVDGAIDNARRDARSTLSAASRNRSPRLLHRSAPTGAGAWYGPHCRRVGASN